MIIINTDTPAQPSDRDMAHALRRVVAEYARARRRHPPMTTAHHGYAVLLEELDELWDEIKKQDPSRAAMRIEAIQIAAMAVSFALEIAVD